MLCFNNLKVLTLPNVKKKYNRCTVSAVHISMPENFLRSRFTTNVDQDIPLKTHFISVSVNNKLLVLYTAY